MLPTYIAYGERIGVEPFPAEDQKPKATGVGFKVVDQKVSLRGLRVLIGSDKYPTGSTVFVSSEGYAHDWAKKVYNVDGMSFILIPVSFINFVRVGDVPETASISHSDPRAL